MLFGTFVFLVTSLRGTNGLLAPSYVSEWLWMDVNNVSTTNVTLNHNFGVRPVKADVQVKSPNTNFIYPGVRSAHSQREDGERGGVICLYGENTVRLLGATNDGASSNIGAYIIYTGNTTWLKANGEALQAAWVRVRLWNPADLPSPSYTTTFAMSAEGRNGQNYIEHAHNLGVVPVLTVVQYYSPHTSSYFSTMVAEAQGTNAVQITGHDSESSFVFGVSESNIRLWAVNQRSGISYGIFSFCKGWGYYTTSTSDCYFRDAHVDVSIWTEIDSSSMDTQQGTLTVTNGSPHEYSFTPFSASLGLVIVTSTPTNEANNGYAFDGTGAAMTDGIEKSAGLIYAYNEDGRVRLWHPLSPHCIVQVGPLMGEGNNINCDRDVALTIRVWQAGCPWIEVENAVATGNVDQITYECNNGSIYVSGNLERSCQGNSTWNGTLPVCETGCPWIEVENAVATGTVKRVIYECNNGSIHVSGNLERSCQENSMWNGTLPVCKRCAALETGSWTSLDGYLLSTQNIANFTCVEGYYLVSGNLTRHCNLPNATWSGAPPICEALSTTSSTTTVTPTTSTTTTSTSTTPGTTTLPSVVEVCYNVTNTVYNYTTLAKETEEIIANLTVDAKTTSKFERSKTSAKDDRSSSMLIGLLGYLMFGILGALIVLPDFFSVVRFFCNRRNAQELNRGNGH